MKTLKQPTLTALTVLVGTALATGSAWCGVGASSETAGTAQAAPSTPRSEATRSSQPNKPTSGTNKDTKPRVVREKVVSKDGTSIAYDQSGEGPVLILVASALADRSGAARLAGFLARDFTVINYDRRGRGASGDTPPYAVEREIEDIEALIDKNGGSGFLFGNSSGAALALTAAAKLPAKIRKLAVFEPPFIVDNTRPPIPVDFVTRVQELVASSRRGEAVAYFMTEGVGMPVEAVDRMRKAPMWAGMERLAHTLAYDGLIMGDTQAGKPLPAKRWSSATARTLVIDGEKSDAFLRNSAQALAGVLPHAERRTLNGQNHGVVVMAPEALVPVLVEFFSDQTNPR